MNPFLPNQTAPNMMPMNNTPMPGSSAPAGADNFEVDLTNVQDNFSIPDGKYKVKCTEIEQNVSKGGNPMFVWTFQVVEGQYAGFESKVFTAITPAAMWKVAETVQALGVGQTGTVVKFKRSDVINKECGAIIEQSEYNGTTRSQIAKVITLQELAESRS
jgi:hypothetical protein